MSGCNCDYLWKKKQPGQSWAWLYGLIWRICGCRTPKVNVEICTVNEKRATYYCREAGTAVIREFNEGSEPAEDNTCDFHLEPPSPPEWKGDVCKESTKRKRSKYCIQIHEVTLPEQPPVCDLHPGLINPLAIPDIHAHWLGDNNWWRVEAWEKKNQERLERELRDQCIALRGKGIKEKDGFSWLVSGKQEHRHLNTKAPWKWERSNGTMVFHLDQWEPRFFELLERYLEIHKICDIDYCTHLYMGFGYNKYPFEHNFQNVRRFIETGKPMDQQPAMPYQLAYAEKVCQTYKKVYGADYKPWIKFINEPAHGGDGIKFHDWMYWHETMYNSVMKNYTDLKHCILDISACEGVLGELREPHDCPKPGASNCRNGRHGKDPLDREGMGETHGWSTRADFASIPDGGTKTHIGYFLGSANKWRKFTEDAGGHAKDGKGPVWGPYIFGNAEQQLEMSRYIYGKTHGRTKRIIFGSFAIECLFKLEEDGKPIFKSFYTLENLEKKQVNGESYFDRLDAVIQGWLENYRPD